MHDSTGLRPTSDRVRETLFNWLQHELVGRACLDLYAGTGALGFEAASRGAERVVMIERDPRLAASLRETARRIGAGQADIRCAAAEQIVPTLADAGFDILFLDPPFADGLPGALWPELARVSRSRSWLYLEQGGDACEPPETWQLHREGRTKEVRYALYRRKPTADQSTADD